MNTQSRSVAPPPVTRPPLDVDRVRADFPILERTVRGHRLAYLDSAATSQRPRRVVEALSAFYLEHNANVHRGVHVLSEEASSAYDRARELGRRLLGASRAEEIVFTAGTTSAINLVAQTWGAAQLKGGDEILITAYEHHSNIVPWQLAAHRVGAVLLVIPTLPDGSLDIEAADALLTPRTRLVAVSHVSNVLGTVSPLAHLIRRAHSVGAAVLVDGAQGAPRLPVNVQALDCDFYTVSGHKLYGPTGIGLLYGRAELLARMPPWQTGGGMIERVTYEATSFAPPPARFEAGTPPIAQAVGLGAAIEYVDRLGIDAIEAHERALMAYATDVLAEVPDLRLIGTAPGKIGVISFLLGDIHPHDVATVLDAAGVAVRAGHHCAQPLMDRLGVTATLRASFGVYSNRADVDQLAEALHAARKRFAA